MLSRAVRKWPGEAAACTREAVRLLLVKAPRTSVVASLAIEQDARMQEIYSTGERPDRETMMAERKKYNDSRDQIIKAAINEDQFKIWKEIIEPSMRPTRPNGGG